MHLFIYLLQIHSLVCSANIYEALQHGSYDRECQENRKQSLGYHRGRFLVGGDNSQQIYLVSLFIKETLLLERLLGFSIENWTELSKTFSTYCIYALN